MSTLTAHRAAAIDLMLTAGGSTFTVKQACMAPAICAGDQITIERCAHAELTRGDIVLLHQNNRLTLHRYLGAWSRGDESYLLCKADTRRRPDRPWPHAALVGRLIGVATVDNARWECDQLGRLALAAYHLAARIGIAVGVFPALATRHTTLSFAVNVLQQVWTIQLSAPADRAAELASLRDEFCLYQFAEEENKNRVAQATITVHLAAPDAPLTDPEPTDRPEILVATERLLVRMPAGAAGGEIIALDCTAAHAGIEAVFRRLAMRACVMRGGIALHAASAVSDEGHLYLFAGPSGAGKSTAALTFGAAQQVDRDFVCLLPVDGKLTRVPVFPFHRESENENSNTRINADDNAPHLVCEPRALLLPTRGEGVLLETLHGADAVRACLHRPPEPLSPAATERLIERSEMLAQQIPIYRLTWSLDADLPAALRATGRR